MKILILNDVREYGIKFMWVGKKFCCWNVLSDHKTDDKEVDQLFECIKL